VLPYGGYHKRDYQTVMNSIGTGYREIRAGILSKSGAQIAGTPFVANVRIADHPPGAVAKRGVHGE
jgi:hypothetical protein